MWQCRVISVFLALLFVSARQSDAAHPWKIRKLPRILVHVEPAKDVSPAPSPGLASNGTKDSGKKAIENEREVCLASPRACHVEELTGCLMHAENAPEKLILVLQNKRETPMQVKATFLPANISDEIQLDQKEIKEVDVTAKVQGSSSIKLNADKGNCVVQLKSPSSESRFSKNFPYASRVTPVHGLYLLFAVVLVIGGVWACCNFSKNERHVDGVPYHEIEMGRTVADSTSVVDVEVEDGWDESWDDDWGDEIREVKPSPKQSRLGNGSANGHQSKSSSKDEWDDNWEH